MADTRRRILDTARELFNERGVHRVGVREVARAVGVSPGNLAYHFATKDALVSELVLELHGRAEELFAALPADFSLLTLYATAVAAMRRTLEYRFVLLSYADAVAASPALRALEVRLWRNRRRRYADMLDRLVANRFVAARVEGRRRRLYEQGEMISSGWLVAASVGRGPRGDGAALLHYAKLGCALLEPYCTRKGARQMERILAGELDAALAPRRGRA